VVGCGATQEAARRAAYRAADAVQFAGVQRRDDIAVSRSEGEVDA
jgi:phosphoribosylamine-glycine ligase